MPWHIENRDGQFCVVKGHHANPGKTEKCYPDRASALKYLNALYANSPDMNDRVRKAGH